MMREEKISACPQDHDSPRHRNFGANYSNICPSLFKIGAFWSDVALYYTTHLEPTILPQHMSLFSTLRLCVLLPTHIYTHTYTHTIFPCPTYAPSSLLMQTLQGQWRAPQLLNAYIYYALARPISHMTQPVCSIQCLYEEVGA